MRAMAREVYRVALTGGPCGGKTTGQDRLACFFESLGWKVFRVPETATVLLNGGVKFDELNADAAFSFQENLLKTMMQIESTYFQLADAFAKNCLIICDRGTMDPSAYIDSDQWSRIMAQNQLNAVEIRDNRYNQVVHMVTAADGAEKFYSLSNNCTRHEGLQDARDRDMRTRQAWIGHPYFDVVDNQDCQSFEDKIVKLIQVVCDRANVQYGDRLEKNALKRKWLVRSINRARLPVNEEFAVVHDYLNSTEPDTQLRIRRRGQNGVWGYSQTTRRVGNKPETTVETRMPLSKREYEALRSTNKDRRRVALHKTRCCFTFGQQYFQLDKYDTLPPHCPQTEPLMVLETYTTKRGDLPLPDFLDIAREVTGDQRYSMFNMSLSD